ncbi:tyrosine-type recombinase/integrase [Clostridium tertium]|uniref:tyrosine-type recombinase/integrase n=1 Tax=Clostridium tertium TaxID=1559 RepID=UPI003569C34F
MRRKLTIRKENNMTFEEGCQEFLNSCKARNLREGTLKHYRESINSINRFIEPNTSINNFNEDTVGNFVITCKENLDVSDTTIYTYSRDLKTLLYFFMKREYISTFKIELPSVDKEPIETYTDAELKILLKKPDLKKCSFSEYKAWVIINFLLSTGIRMNSLINIKIKDLDFDNEVVHVNVTKNRKPLIIPLNETIVKILKDYLKVRQHESDADYLFCNVYGKKFVKSTMYGSLVNYHHKRGITKTGIHRYRHTFAKKWIQSGGSVVVLQKVLGHSSLAITENYINLLVEDLKKDINKFNILEEFNSKYIKIKK